MITIVTEEVTPDVYMLLSHATSPSKVKHEYKLYIGKSNRVLYGYALDRSFIGCIGIKIINGMSCEIKHIAVDVTHRGQGIGRAMVHHVQESFTYVVAETDKDAVGFYQELGFTVTSLGEKYPGVERFRCVTKKS